MPARPTRRPSRLRRDRVRRLVAEAREREPAERDDEAPDPEVRRGRLAERPPERDDANDTDGRRDDRAAAAEHRSEDPMQRGRGRVRVLQFEPRREQQIEEAHHARIGLVAGDPRRRDETRGLQGRDRREDRRRIVEAGALGMPHRELTQAPIAVEVFVDREALFDSRR